MNEIDLPENQQKAIHLLCEGCTVQKVAEEVGVNRRTIYYWMKDEDFKSKLNFFRRKKLEAMFASVSSLYEKASIRLSDLLESMDEGIAIKAVNSVFSTAFKIHAEDVNERLDKLEEQLKGDK
jgi:AcrR family transcriptional regulator